MKHKATFGDRVRVKCWRLPGVGAEALPRRWSRTFEFAVGSLEAVPGLSVGVVGMAAGDRKRLSLQPLDAYGPALVCLMRELPRRRPSQRIPLEVGKWLTHVEPVSGVRERVRIVEIKPDSIVVDGNHPLAGRVVELDVALLSVDSSSHANPNKQQFEMGGES